MTGRSGLLRLASGDSAHVGTVQTHLELGAQPTAVPCARLHTLSVASEWGLHRLAETAELLVSELVTNAIQASQRLTRTAPPVVHLWLVRDQNGITICVWDASPDMPVRHDAGPDEDSGRGLMIIDTVSSDRGAYRKDGGKIVWARIDAGASGGREL
jgi:anti-sigma regulatory factor (Ser/Thr protein kinase)